jgi:hypothetical protein
MSGSGRAASILSQTSPLLIYCQYLTARVDNDNSSQEYVSKGEVGLYYPDALNDKTSERVRK